MRPFLLTPRDKSLLRPHGGLQQYRRAHSSESCGGPLAPHARRASELGLSFFLSCGQLSSSTSQVTRFLPFARPTIRSSTLIHALCDKRENNALLCGHEQGQESVRELTRETLHTHNERPADLQELRPKTAHVLHNLRHDPVILLAITTCTPKLVTLACAVLVGTNGHHAIWPLSRNVARRSVALFCACVCACVFFFCFFCSCRFVASTAVRTASMGLPHLVD